MKSKIIFSIILFSLLLNIFHDLLIEQQVQTETSMLIVIDKSQKVEKTLCDLHEVFHFIAIIPLFEPLGISSKVSTKLSFSKKISSQNILESSFKPPRV
jgi:hypothetical protein